MCHVEARDVSNKTSLTQTQLVSGIVTQFSCRFHYITYINVCYVVGCPARAYSITSIVMTFTCNTILDVASIALRVYETGEGRLWCGHWQR